MSLRNLRLCSKCVLPHTYAGIAFDENGVCNICKQSEIKEAKNFVEKEEELKKIFEHYKGKGKYDCLVPYSGGKDSSFVLYICKKYGMNPLAYNFNNHFQSSIGRENMENVVQALGVPMINFSPDWQVAKKLCIKGLKKNGDFCWFCNSGALATSIQRAVQENIPLVVFGEESGEYSGTLPFDASFTEVFKSIGQEGLPASEFIDDEIDLEKLSPYSLPPVELLNKTHPIFLGSYIKWDKDEILKIIKKELGWKEAMAGAVTSFEHIDCSYSAVRDYIKFLKRGFSRFSQLASIKVREGKMTREEALKEAEKDGARPANLDEFLEKLNLSEDVFMDIIAQHKVN